MHEYKNTETARVNGAAPSDLTHSGLFESFCFFYLLLLQRLDYLLHAHLQVLDVVLLCLQQLLDDLGPLLQHPQLRVLGASAGRGRAV